MIVRSFPLPSWETTKGGGDHQPVSVNIDGFVVSGHIEALAAGTAVSQVRGSRREVNCYRKWNNHGLIMSE